MIKVAVTTDSTRKGQQPIKSMMLDRTKKAIELIGAASCIGAPDHRCESGPLILRSKGLISHFEQLGYSTRWTQLVQPFLDDSDPQKLVRIASFCRDLADRTYHAVTLGTRFAVVGGDHSCAVGTWSGVYRALHQKGPVGLIWIDAHMDAHTPKTSHSGAIHGMPLASLLGFGDASLTNIAAAQPKLKPQHVCLIGVRSFEPEEKALLTGLGVRIYYIEDIQRRGLKKVFEEAVKTVSSGTAGFGISIDVDAIDPGDAPGVGSPEPNGLSGQQLVEAITHLGDRSNFLGLELAEFNPVRDSGDKTADLALEILYATFQAEAYA